MIWNPNRNIGHPVSHETSPPIWKFRILLPLGSCTSQFYKRSLHPPPKTNFHACKVLAISFFNNESDMQRRWNRCGRSSLSRLLSQYCPVSELVHAYLSPKKSAFLSQTQGLQCLAAPANKTQENISLGLEGGAGIRYPMFLIYKANSSNMVTFHVCIQRDCCWNGVNNGLKTGLL
jgi:hypothetical protein